MISKAWPASPVKVGILSFYNGLIDRGVETWAKMLKEKLKREINVDIFGGEDFSESIDWKNKHKIYWVVLLLRHFIKNLPKLGGYDLVIPTNGTVQVFACRIFTWLKRKPMVVFGHSGPGADDKWNLLCSPNIFVAFSTHQKEWAEKFKLPWTKVVLIPHAVDLTRFLPAKRKPNKKVVLCVAANSAAKRIVLVEKAVKLINGATFLAVGKDNPIEASFDEMPSVYRKADVFCFVPQPWEAFGLVFLEAMASNLPVVTLNDPIRREIIGGAGILVDHPENPAELSKAIKTALKTKWESKPRIQAMKFSWEKIVPMYERLFADLV